MEGWVRIRIAGQTDWKRLWIVISAADPLSGSGDNLPSGNPRKKRMSSLFGREPSPSRVDLPSKPLVTAFVSPKPKDRKKPLLTMDAVTQAFTVFPGPELISRSTLIKVEGMFGDEEVLAGMRGREGWLLMMPDIGPNVEQAKEMLKWVLGENFQWTMLI